MARPITFYEGVAAKYDDLLSAAFFERPAGDLVRLAGLTSGEQVLDVGTGTGVVARVAQACVGPEGRVVGLDGSRGMLARAQTPGPASMGLASKSSQASAGADTGAWDRVRWVLGDANRPPLRERAFDAVLGGFVLSHLNLDTAGLAPLVALVRAGGTVAMSAWSPVEPPAAKPWAEVAASYIDLDELRIEGSQISPHEDALMDPDGLEPVFRDAGLDELRISQRHYPVEVDARAFVQMTAALPGGALLHRRVGPEGWPRFEDEAVEAIEAEVGQRVAYELAVWFVVAGAPI